MPYAALRGELSPHLTPREIEILQLVANGYTGIQIARKLSISGETVRNIQTMIRERLGVPSAPAAVAAAMRRGLIE